jgi:hypothetical protein
VKDQREYNPVGMWGCYFCCLGKIAEDVTGKVLTDEQVMEVYRDAVDVGAMGWNCFINQPSGVLRMFFDALELPRAARYIGWWNIDMKTNGPEMFNGHLPTDITHTVTRIKTKFGHHFRLDNYDPMGIIGTVEVTGKRYFRIV